MSLNSLCFDARMARASGIGTYIQGLVPELAAQLPGGCALTCLTNGKGGWIPPGASYPVSPGIYSLTEQAVIPWAFHRTRAEILHVPHYNIPLLMAQRCVVTVHDLIHLKFPEFLPSKLAYGYAYAFFHHWIPRARALLTVSENSKKDLVETLGIPPDKITVTFPGVPAGFNPVAAESYEPALAALDIRPGYFLYVGNLKEFKNVQRLLAAYILLKRKHPEAPPFVFVGRNFIPGFDKELESAAGVRWLSEVERGKLPGIYSAALALVFPSLYEGFGLPPLEAMACGTPVICSNRGSLLEVVGQAAIIVDPLSTDSLVEAMKKVWQDRAVRGELAVKGMEQSKRFSWAAAAAKTIQVYEKCLNY